MKIRVEQSDGKDGRDELVRIAFLDRTVAAWKRLQKTQQEIAAELGISAENCSRIENGWIWPKLQENGEPLQRMAECIGVEVHVGKGHRTRARVRTVSVYAGVPCPSRKEHPQRVRCDVRFPDTGAFCSAV